MAVAIGNVTTIIGTATAISADGTERILSVGDAVYAGEVISTHHASAIEIEFHDGSLMDLGRNSQMVLDTAIFNPQLTTEAENTDDIAAIQESLLSGDDPTLENEAPASGSNPADNEGGISFVVIDHIEPTVNVTSRFDRFSEPANDPNMIDTDENLFESININTIPDTIGETTPAFQPPEDLGIPQAPVITQASDGNTVRGTHDSAETIKIIIKDNAGNVVSEHSANIFPDGTWSADFIKPAIGDYTMTAIATNHEGVISDESNSINLNVVANYQHPVDHDDAINIVYDNNTSSTHTTGAGNDLFLVGRGNDTFNAGSGDDTFIVEGANKGFNSFKGGDGNDLIQGGDSDDIIGLTSFNASNSIEAIDGGDGSNVIQGSTYSNLDFSATELRNIDSIEGGNGTNTIIGSQGDDTINAGRGNDIITGGQGDDILTGGDGNDLFVWSAADIGSTSSPAKDEITDFQGNTNDVEARTQDVLDLADLLSDGSHTIEGLAVDDAVGGGKHLQISIKEASSGDVVQSIDLNNISVNLGDNPTDMLNTLLTNGGINDGI